MRLHEQDGYRVACSEIRWLTEELFPVSVSLGFFQLTNPFRRPAAGPESVYFNR